MTPLVSVVVPTVNRPHLLHHALSSLAGQRSVPGAVEVIVVNDGGVDVSMPVDAARDRRLVVHVVNLARGRGLSTARNIGVEVARGEFLAFLDDDDVFLPDHLSTALTAFSTADVDAVYTTCLIGTSRVDPTGPLEITEEARFPFDADMLCVANFLEVHSVVLRRPPTQARFDPALTALEDWDMWLQLVLQHGWRFAHVPRPTVVYHRIPDQPSMCATAATDAAALATFGRLHERLWRRWPAPTSRVARFRLYLAVMYWHALASLADGEPIANLYFHGCMRQIAAAWHGTAGEDGLTDRIIEAIHGGVDVARAG